MDAASPQDIGKRVKPIRDPFLFFTFLFLNMSLWREVSGWTRNVIYAFMMIGYIWGLAFLLKTKHAERAIAASLLGGKKAFLQSAITWLILCLLTDIFWLPFVGLVFAVGLLPRAQFLETIVLQFIFSFVLVSFECALTKLLSRHPQAPIDRPHKGSSN